jgi:putative oxidoreductase
MRKFIRLVGVIYGKLALFSGWPQCALLLAIRLYWGFQFAQDGWGKLTHLERVTQFFTSLNLPAPGLEPVINFMRAA